MLFITQRLQAYLLKITSGRWPPFTSMHCCKRVWKLLYTCPRWSSSIAATSSTMASLSSWTVMIRLRTQHTVFQGPPQEKLWHSKVRRPSRPSDVAETTNTGNTLLHVPMLHCEWPYEMASSPLPANDDKLSRQRNIQIWNVSVDCAPPCINMVIPTPKHNAL